MDWILFNFFHKFQESYRLSAVKSQLKTSKEKTTSAEVYINGQ